MATTETYNVVVYGNTWAAVNAACAATIKGASVALVSNYKHIGGIISNGLSAVDIGRYGSRGVGWLSDEFFTRHTNLSGTRVTLRRVSPSRAELVFNEMLKAYGVYVRAGYTLASVGKSGATITSMTMTDGTVFNGSVFIDGTEEGDLAKMAGVTMVVGRESQSQYNEPLAGFYPVMETFTPLDVYNGGSLIEGVSPYPATVVGAADGGIQAYGFRLPLTKNKENMRAWPKPAGYDPNLFEFLRRLYANSFSNEAWLPFRMAACVDGIGDMNADFGMPDQWAWPDATPTQRQAILTKIYNLQAGWMWFLANDPSINAKTQDYVNSFGLCIDQLPFADNTAAGWPGELYVRQARRMVGQYVMTQNDMQVDITKTDNIAMGFYSLDFHNTRRLAVTVGGVAGVINDSFGMFNDVDGVRQVKPYQIPYRATLPLITECDNLMVPVAASVSSVAGSSWRIDLHKANVASANGLAAAYCIAGSYKPETVKTVFSTFQAELISLGHVVAYTPPA